MPPDAEQATGEYRAFTNSFWSKDRTGVDNLLTYIHSRHNELQTLHDIYLQRCKLEREYGERLLAMAKGNAIQEQEQKETDAADSPKEEGKADTELCGVSAVFETVSLELQHTAQSHLKLAANLEERVATEFEDKLNEYKELLDKWSTTLDEIYNERQEKINQLIKIRTKYLREHELSKGKLTPVMEKLKEQYKNMVTIVDDIAQEWNALWKEACEVMEAMEEDRVEMLRSNVWEYANLTSASLLIQDEWCERIRHKLEICNVDDEIEKCVSLYATGSKVPSTNDYVGEMMKAYKRKQHTRDGRSPAPVPPAKPTKQTETPKSQSHTIDSPSDESETKRETRVTENIHESEDKPTKVKPQTDERKMQSASNADVQRSISMSSGSTEGTGTISTVMNRGVSNNMGSTATRGQVRRKPLNKTLMEQVSNEMAKARQQRERTQEDDSSLPTSPISGIVGQKKLEMTGSLDNLLKSFETNEPVSKSYTKPSPSSQEPPEAPVSEEAKNRRQPSEYKPDSGSLPSKKNSSNRPTEGKADTKGLNEGTAMRSDSVKHATNNTAMNAPKSPRPTAQQIQPTNDSNTSDPIAGSMQNTHAQTYNKQSFPSHHNGGHYTHNSPTYMQHQQQPQQHFMGHQPLMNHPPIGHSPMMQHSPIMHPQRSPLMAPMQAAGVTQPHHSPMMHPQPSPLAQPQQSPMMQPRHSPMMQPAAAQSMPHHHQQQQQQIYGTQPRGTLPAPISIPNTTNYMVSPQPSPALSYANLGGVSPGGVLPPPAISSPYTQPMQTLPRPLQYSDGTPIQFWARAKYDYAAKDSDEISFKANNLIGVLEADVTQQAWWFGAVFDEYSQTWSIAGSIPSNFMDILQ